MEWCIVKKSMSELSEYGKCEFYLNRGFCLRWIGVWPSGMSGRDFSIPWMVLGLGS